jgi:hypothetical protein
VMRPGSCSPILRATSSACSPPGDSRDSRGRRSASRVRRLLVVAPMKRSRGTVTSDPPGDDDQQDAGCDQASDDEVPDAGAVFIQGRIAAAVERGSIEDADPGSPPGLDAHPPMPTRVGPAARRSIPRLRHVPIIAEASVGPRHRVGPGRAEENGPAGHERSLLVTAALPRERHLARHLGGWFQPPEGRPPSTSWWAPTCTATTRAIWSPLLCQRWRVPFWTTTSPGPSTTSVPSSSSSPTTPSSTMS